MVITIVIDIQLSKTNTGWIVEINEPRKKTTYHCFTLITHALDFLREKYDESLIDEEL